MNKNIYLILAILGAIFPYVFFIEFLQISGLNLWLFIEAIFVNGAAAAMSVDLIIASIVFWLFLFEQSKNKDNPKPIVFIILNLTVGLSCALPAYFYAKKRLVEQLKR